ncbi:MAG: ABC transporter permease [Coprothermobacterota bacterium]|nr:ABC transporter permease [Coprothermobacterota bacterium]
MDLRTILWIIGMGITAGTPLLYAAIGEVLAERCGVLNLGLEGLMLMGAITGYMFASLTGDKWIGILAVIVISALLGAILALLMVTYRTNQVATGIAFTIFCTGLSALIGKPYIGVVATDTFKKIRMPFLDGVPMLKPIFEQDILVYIAVILCIAAWFFVYKTKAGLHLRAAGDNPATLDSLGVSVYKVRYIYTIVGSILAGIAGAYLSLAYSPSWIEGMAAGRGWLTIALVNFALWKPQNTITGAYLFGIFYALSYRLEAMGIAVPSYFLRMFPYVLPLVILILVSWRAKQKGSIAPKTLAVPYLRGSK